MTNATSSSEAKATQRIRIGRPTGHAIGAPKRQSKITIPERTSPLARVVFAEMRRQGVTYDELEFRSGILRSTSKAWRRNNKPGLESIDAALGALGWNVLPVPSAQTLPAELRFDLEEIAIKHGLADFPVLEFIAACSDYGWREILRQRREVEKAS